MFVLVSLALADDDPYLWLEDIEGDRALAWVREQNGRSEAELEAKAGFAALETRLKGIFGSTDGIPYVGKQGRWYYNIWVDEQHIRGTWRRTSWSEYRKPAPAWETVLDLDALGAAEHESWVWGSATCLEPAERYCMLELSRGGGDAAVFREFDTVTKAFVPAGFTVPESKTSVSWIDQDTLWVGTGTTDAGYPREVRIWKRGTPLEEAPVTFAGRQTDVQIAAYHDWGRDWILRATSFFSTVSWLLREGRMIRLAAPESADVTVARDWLYLRLRNSWGDHPANSLLAVRVEEFLSGRYLLKVVFAPAPGVVLSQFVPTRHGVMIRVLDHLHPRLERWTPLAGTRALPAIPPGVTPSVWAVDPEHTDDVFVTTSGYLQPTVLARSFGNGPPVPVKALPAQFDTAGLVVTEHEATSLDGTRITYAQVARGALALDGSHPTLLTGYGGFGTVELPTYSPHIGAAWLERGGVYVVAHIRGGGELGPAWHVAAARRNRHKAYEDFVAVADDLVARGVTSVPHLAAQGGSNGGLLMGNMLTTYPEHFGAILAMVPLLDMQRYNKLLAGSSWMDEYGDPDKPEDWAWLRAYSPYHNVHAGQRYPRTMFLTSTRDDRVHPGHARKMTARMIEQGHDVVYFENTEGGHGGGADAAQEAHYWALGLTFLWETVR